MLAEAKEFQFRLGDAGRGVGEDGVEPLLPFRQGFHRAFALGNVADVALDDFSPVLPVEVADELDFMALARFVREREISPAAPSGAERRSPIQRAGTGSVKRPT